MNRYYFYCVNEISFSISSQLCVEKWTWPNTVHFPGYFILRNLYIEQWTWPKTVHCFNSSFTSHLTYVHLLSRDIHSLRKLKTLCVWPFWCLSIIAKDHNIWDATSVCLSTIHELIYGSSLCRVPQGTIVPSHHKLMTFIWG